jgi:hypothetical protein
MNAVFSSKHNVHPQRKETRSKWCAWRHEERLAQHKDNEEIKKTLNKGNTMAKVMMIVGGIWCWALMAVAIVFLLTGCSTEAHMTCMNNQNTEPAASILLPTACDGSWGDATQGLITYRAPGQLDVSL